MCLAEASARKPANKNLAMARELARQRSQDNQCKHHDAHHSRGIARLCRECSMHGRHVTSVAPASGSLKCSARLLGIAA